MERQPGLPAPESLRPGIVLLEANRGQTRRRILEEWTARAREHGCAWLLPCDVRETGLWAGLNELVEELVPEVERLSSDSLNRYAVELAAVLPALRSRLRVPEALTDTAMADEAVRNYAVDRAYRIPHGIIDLIDEYQRRAGSPRWVLVCDDYDRGGALVRRFFRELMRRRGGFLNLTLVIAVSPGGAAEASSPFPAECPRHTVEMQLPEDPAPSRSPREMTDLATALESRIREDFAEMEIHIPDLVRYWSESEHPEKAYPWQAFALGRYNHHGFYEDALTYAGPVLAHIDEIATGVGYFTRWNIVGSIFGCLLSVGQVERAYQVVREEALAKIHAPADRARVLYIMAMLHARFLPEKDLDKAEWYLKEGLKLLDAPEVGADHRHFLNVFLNNGLALVRHRQGRAADAIRLCHEGHAELSSYLEGDRHRLHRSVLLYNIAQVYSATGEYEKAVEYFTATMEIDPNYSEYYNERGNIFLKVGRLEDAVRDYHQAIRLSPPYQEVWTNLGQCYRKMGALPNALEAYSRAIDLDPTAGLALGARAQVLDALGRAGEALADYDAALALDPAQPLLRANRAALRYEAGRVNEAVEDLEAAVALMPGNPGLYRNRALALRDVGRTAEAAADLRTYLHLAPGAPDATEVAEQALALELEPAAV